LNGANVHVDEKAMRAFYGENGDSRFRDVLNGTVKPPQAAHQFLASIRQDFHEAAASQ
jgi:lipid-binding SYLF domain-containing protein